MFGYQGGESTETVSRKRGYMKDARQRWSFLTTLDCSMIKNDVQLTSMIKDRSGGTKEQVKSDVEAWMQGKQF